MPEAKLPQHTETAATRRSPSGPDETGREAGAGGHEAPRGEDPGAGEEPVRGQGPGTGTGRAPADDAGATHDGHEGHDRDDGHDGGDGHDGDGEYAGDEEPRGLTPRQARRVRIVVSGAVMAAVAVALVVRVGSAPSMVTVGFYGVALVLSGTALVLSRLGRTRVATAVLLLGFAAVALAERFLATAG